MWPVKHAMLITDRSSSMSTSMSASHRDRQFNITKQLHVFRLYCGPQNCPIDDFMIQKKRAGLLAQCLLCGRTELVINGLISETT
jgi:hypothetical protein